MKMLPSTEKYPVGDGLDGKFTCAYEKPDLLDSPWSTKDEKKSRTTSGSSSLSESYGDGYLKNGRFIRNHGIHWILAALFCVGDMAGAGIVALPTAVIQCQFWPGLVICGMMVICATSSSIFLGKSWSILLKRWPEYRTHCRKPYAEIGFRALGKPAKTAVSICINTTLFGATVVFLLLSAKNIHDFMDAFFSTSISFCYLVIIVAVALLPVLMLKSPQDFWWVIVVGMASTAAAIVLLTMGAAFDYGACAPHRHMPDFKVLNYFLALGTVLFTFGGLAAFPTIQHDMKRPHEFTKSSFLAFAVICAFYIPVVTVGFLSYGDSVRESIINSIQTKWVQQAVNIMITVHCLLTITLLANPLNQEVEELLGAPQSFGWKRVAVRSGVLLVVVFVAESVPNFGPLLNLVGGSAVTLSSVVFPSIFFLYLTAGDKVLEEEGRSAKDFQPKSLKVSQVIRKSDPKMLALCGFILAFGLIGGVAATFSAVRALSSTQFTAPCYVAPFLHHHDAAINGTENTGHTNCCGGTQDIYRFGDVASHCTKEDHSIYDP